MTASHSHHGHSRGGPGRVEMTFTVIFQGPAVDPAFAAIKAFTDRMNDSIRSAAQDACAELTAAATAQEQALQDVIQNVNDPALRASIGARLGINADAQEPMSLTTGGRLIR